MIKVAVDSLDVQRSMQNMLKNIRLFGTHDIREELSEWQTKDVNRNDSWVYLEYEPGTASTTFRRRGLRGRRPMSGRSRGGDKKPIMRPELLLMLSDRVKILSAEKLTWL